MPKAQLYTAESVSPKHPDKICDQISDAILDACLAQDPHGRVAVEAMGGHGLLTVTGEITTNAKLNIKQIAARFVPKGYIIRAQVVQQSPEIAHGVNSGGAGDQGIMVGYATAATPAAIPPEAYLARELNQQIFRQFPHDGKTQVTLVGNKITAVVASFQHASGRQLKKLVTIWLKGKPTAVDIAIYANPAGDWQVGGFESDAGLTGRKLMVDNYGPQVPVGGGCFSGKDPTKVDRSAAYMARKVAVDYLHAKGAQEVTCRLAYAIGVAEPVQATVAMDGKPEKVKGYDLRPRGIIEFLQLNKPQYEQTAKWGHFGNNFTWDQ